MRPPLLRAALACALVLCGFAAARPATPALAAGALTQTWSTTVHVGPGSSRVSTVSGEPLGGATVADLFGDGRKQVVVGFMDGSVSVLDGTSGREMPGWPQYTVGAMHTNPSVADLHNDGRQEVIATSEAGRVYVWNGDGSLAPGWPQHSNPPPNTSPGFFGGVAVGDLFGDGSKELVAASWDQHLYAWSRDGALLPGFPIHVWDTAFDTPALVDIEHRGQLDIVVGFDSSGPPNDPYQRGGEVWAFRPTGCSANAYADRSGCALPGWPQTFDQVPWASPAAADLLGNGSTDVVEGTGFNFAGPAGQYVNAWTSAGAKLGPWPTGGQNMASPAVGDLFGNGQREVVQASENGFLYAWNGNGGTLPGWPVNLNRPGLLANPTIGPISSSANGVWIVNLGTLEAFDNLGRLVWSAGGLDWGGFAAPAIADLGSGQLSVVTVDQTVQSNFDSWTVRAFAIPGVTRMLPGAWPTFHGNAQLSGTILPSATLTTPAPTQGSTGITLGWRLDPTSVPAADYRLWVQDQGGGGWSLYGRTTAMSLPFFGYPGHGYRFAIQAGASEPSFSTGVVSTAFASTATWSTPFREMYAVDGHGLLDGGSSAPIANPSSWPGWDIVRGLALSPGGLGGYVLDGFGGVHPFGNAPQVAATGYWSGWDIARGIALRPDGHSGYVLDGWGGLHPFGTAGDIPPAVDVTGYWQGWDIGRDVQLRPDGQSGYVLDGWGGLHPFGAPGDMAAPVQASGWWQRWDIAHRFALDAAGTGGYVLDGFGGLHPYGTPGGAPTASTQATAYWSGWDIARGVVLIPGSTTAGYVADSWGGMHPFGGAPVVSTPTATPGDSIKQLAVA